MVRLAPHLKVGTPEGRVAVDNRPAPRYHLLMVTVRRWFGLGYCRPFRFYAYRRPASVNPACEAR